MARRRRSKWGEGPFWPLPYSTAKHDAFRALSGPALKVLIELRTRFTVYGDRKTNNNGQITLSVGEAARVLGMSKSTVQRAFSELEAAGFIEKVKQGHWYGRKATEWRVTDCPCNGLPATRDWERIWKAKNL